MRARTSRSLRSPTTARPVLEVAAVRRPRRPSNPVDLLGDASPSTYQAAIAAVAEDPGVDALVVIHAPTLVADPDAVAAAIASANDERQAARRRHHRTRPQSARRDGEQPVPVFGSVEPAIAALGHAVTYAAWRARPADPEPSRDDIDLRAAKAFVDRVLAS